MTEAQYQAKLIKRLNRMFPGCLIMKNDPSYLQGILDLTILYKHTWAALEVKAYDSAPLQPNQQFYLDQLNGMSFAAIICPENEEVVLDALQEAFASRGRSCVPQS